MLFGLKNALATYNWLINSIIAGLEGVCSYLEGIVIFGHNWSDHMKYSCSFFLRATLQFVLVTAVSYSRHLSDFSVSLGFRT